MEVEDLKMMVAFGWELVSFGTIDVAREEEYFNLLKQKKYFDAIGPRLERLKVIAHVITGEGDR
ncbi:hypothetical protein CONLIGDRAFT_638514 [Coniochaeta ligniaria NRRL 30616]|uniref:Uncharacterized protein n=1 Tax=Coniochaeta ligniaria NRRL 30616 TaxID=1408157 RepID=A0A1J7IM33_9PEZI|nr:hypothetical protein CONLIGDRAFT_638514 [Coniochaeta ligniaria NRRL 30616]